MELGERIAAWRAFKGMSQRELARRLKISHPAISQWEDGSTKPTQDNLAKIVDEFGISMERFYGRVPVAKAS